MQLGPEGALEEVVSGRDREPPHRSQPRTAAVNRSVARSLRLLLDVAHGSRSLSFAEFQSRHKLPKATLHKLLATLESMNFLRRDTATGRYSIGVAALEFSAGYAAGPDDLPTILAPIMRGLVNEWKETIHLGVVYGGEEVMLQRLDPPDQVVRVGISIARRHPAYATAGGLASMALSPDNSFLESLPAEFPPRTKNTVKTPAELLARLEAVRKDGYAIDYEEAYVGVRCVGVAVAVPPWPMVHISFTLPLQRAPIERLRALAKPLMVAAKEIEKILLVTPPRA
jgi:IclR family acetate operon transcriptional repressor